MPGKAYIGELGPRLPAIAASEGQQESGLTYGPRTSLTLDGPDMRDRVVLTESFAMLPQRQAAAALPNPDPHYAVTGVNAATSSQSFGENGVQLGTAGAIGDQVVLGPRTGESLFGSQMTTGLFPLARFRIGILDVVGVRYEVGVRLTTNAFDDGTDNNKMIVRFDTSDGVVSATNWVLVTSNGGADQVEDTGITILDNADYLLTLATDSDRRVFLFVSDGNVTDQLVCNPENHQLAVAGNQIGVPYMAVVALAAGAKVFRAQGLVRSQALLLG